MRRAVFLDRDGTLIRDLHHDFRPDAIEVLPGVIEGLADLRARGYLLVVVTNQSGVARGYCTEDDVQVMHAALDLALAEAGLWIDAYYFCPHHPDGTVVRYAGPCDCRKPKPGLLKHAAEDLGVDLDSSWLVGNAPSDVLAGRAAGCRTVLIAERSPSEHGASADVVAGSFSGAVNAILRNVRERQAVAR